MAGSNAVLLTCMVTALCWTGDADGVLWSGAQDMAEHVSAEDIEAVLASELAGALGGGLAETKLAQAEDVLRPTFNTLPKNEHGNLGPAVVRYALHRYFVQKHGWFVKGLELTEAGQHRWSQNASSPTAILRERVPSDIEALFELHLGGRGYGLRQLAVLASTLEHLVHDEAMGRLQASYQAHQFLPTDLVTEDEAKEIIEAYMLSFIFGQDLSNTTRPQLYKLKKVDAPKKYFGWTDTQMWLKDMQLSVRYADRGVSNPFVRGGLDFPSVARAAEDIADRFGRFQDSECQGFKKELMDREHQIPGRVLLSDFYKKGLKGIFRESIEFLRQRGALDESDPKMPPSVIIPNYINFRTNCLGKSNFYLICCIDECEGLMGHLDREIAMPAAEPQRIAALVASMPSDTMDAPRNLSAALLTRLDAIAEHHAGRVPLHGRLFAQWMHHAYPNECQLPHTRGAKTGAKAILTPTDMREYINQSTVEVDESLVDNYDMPWMDVENLLEEYKQVPTRAAENGFWGFVRCLVLLLVVASMAVSMSRASKSAVASLDSAKFEKYCV